MPHQQKKIRKVIISTASWFFAYSIFFLFFKAAGPSLLPLYKDIENQTAMTQFGVLLMQTNWTAWFGLIATGTVASIFGHTFQRRKPAR